MYKKLIFVLLVIFSMLLVSGTVCGTEVKKYDSSSNSALSSKSLAITQNPIKNIATSRPTFRAGTTIKIRVTTTNSVKSKYTYVSGKSAYKLKKSSSSGIWYYDLKTKGYKTGKYKLNIKAITSKKKVYTKYTNLTVDNVAPKLRSIKSNVTSITAGNHFSLEVIADKSSKKVFTKVRGKTISFKPSPIYANNTKGYNSFNSNNWTLNTKISYKEIGTLDIAVYVYDSVGNYIKKNLYIHSSPRYVYWDGTLLRNSPIKTYYSNPTSNYQKSINVLNKYVSVYEGYTGNAYTLGITYNNGYKATKVIIAYKDPFVVYHEMGHVLNWQWTEYQCDLYAYKKVGYWIL